VNCDRMGWDSIDGDMGCTNMGNIGKDGRSGENTPK
jgi:hypothetical protein